MWDAIAGGLESVAPFLKAIGGIRQSNRPTVLPNASAVLQAPSARTPGFGAVYDSPYLKAAIESLLQLPPVI